MKLVYLFIGLGLVFIVFQSFRSLSAAKIENQKYRVVKIEEGFEIRFYPKATFATIQSNGTNYKQVASSGFRKLAGYIFGGNDQNKSIAMTAPAISIMTLMFGLPVALAGVSVITLGGAFGMWKYIPKFDIN